MRQANTSLALKIETSTLKQPHMGMEHCQNADTMVLMTEAGALDTIISLRRQFIQPVADMQKMQLVEEAVLTAKPLVLTAR